MKAMQMGAALMLVGIFVAGSTRAEAESNSWTGPVEKTQHNVPRLVASDTHFRLQPSEKATDAVKEILKKIGSGELTGTYIAKGKRTEVEGKAGILVDTIEKKVEGAAGNNEKKGEGARQGEREKERNRERERNHERK